MKRIKLVSCGLKPQDQVVCEQLDDILVEGLVLRVAAVGLDEYVLKTVLRAVFGIDDQVLEKLIHIRLKDIPKVDRVINLSKYQHKVL